MEDVRIGPYRVLGPLGSGGMGNVYRAVHESLGREVAIKVMGDEARGDAAERRFVREGRLAAGVDHPCLVRIFDVGVERGQLYLVMELVDGLTLDRLLARTGPIHWATAFAIVARAADALATLHAAGTLHRDIKPSNIMVTADGAVKVLDLGLARAVGSTMITVTGEFVGTLRYVAPEVLIGEPATGAADVWSMGCLIHELVTARPLANADSAQAIVDEILNVGLKPLAPVEEMVPSGVVQLVSELVDQDANRRPDMAQVRDRLTALVDELAGVSLDDVLAPGFLERAKTKPLAPPRSVVPRPARPPTQAGVTQARVRVAPVAPRSSAGGRTVPAGPNARRAFTAFAVGALGALVMGLAMGPRRPQVLNLTPRATPLTPHTAPPASPPATPAAAPSPSRKTPTYTELRAVHRLAVPRLQASGATAAKVIAELRRIPDGIDLGREPGAWLRWVEIASWLDAGARGDPPRDRWPRPSSAALEEAELRLVLGDLSRYQNEVSAQRASVAIRAVVSSSWLGAGWLALGRLLEHEGRAGPAVGAYRVGLSLASPEALEKAPRLVWAGLARALHRVPGHSLEREWLSWIRGDLSDGAWPGLYEAMREEDPDLCLRLLRAGAARPGGEVAALELGRQLAARGEQGEALLVWQRGLRASPRSGYLSEHLVHYHLLRGDVAPCRLLRDAKLLSDELENVVDRCDPNFTPPYRPAAEDRSLTIELLDRVAAGDVDGANARLGESARRMITRPEGRLAVLAALLSSGVQSREREITSLLTEGFHGVIWNVAVGALANPAGRPVFEAAFEKQLAQSSDESGKLSGLRALWLTRNGRFEEAKRVLAGAGEAASKKLLGVVACELATALVDANEPPLKLEEVPELARRPSPAARLIAALAAGRHDDAALAAWESWIARPDEGAWPLIFARIAARASPAVATPERLERVQIAVRYLSEGLWMRNAMETAGKKRGGLLWGDRPRKLSDERVR